jgi:hypothetical protein
MAHIALEDFIGTYRDELIRRCEVKVASRPSPAENKAENHHGVPLFLNQLCEELRDGASQSDEIGQSAKTHGHDLLLKGFTIEQVVHDYGDVCQSVTDLAVEMGAPISTDDFRTLNRCLDNAIAGAVTEFTLKQSANRDKTFAELENLTSAAIVGFRAIRTGNVGVGGHTSAVVERSLLAISALLAAGLPLPPREKPRNNSNATSVAS